MAKITINIPNEGKELIDSIIESKNIQSIELAKFLGVEDDYRENLLEQQLKESYENIMNESNYTPKENVNNNGKSTK